MPIMSTARSERTASLARISLARLIDRAMSRRLADRLSELSFSVLGLFSLLLLLFIAAFIFKEAFPAFAELKLGLFGEEWYPSRGEYGILTMVAGSIAVTALALLIALPLSLGCAIYLSELATPLVYRFARPAVELLVGIPSVVYGLVGMVLLCPLIAKFGGGSGSSVLAAGVVLAVMILPTIATISEDSLRAVPRSYREAAFALGATHWQMIRSVLLPASRPGIVAAVVLGTGRAIGETMAMLMVIGNSPIFPKSLLEPARTLTGNIALEINYATGLHASVLFATGAVLFFLVMLINGIGYVLYRKGVGR